MIVIYKLDLPNKNLKLDSFACTNKHHVQLQVVKDMIQMGHVKTMNVTVRNARKISKIVLVPTLAALRLFQIGLATLNVTMISVIMISAIVDA